MKDSFTILGRLLLGAALGLSSTAYAKPGEYVFTYDYDGAEHSYVGIGRNVQIDAAMHLKNSSFVGFEILGISVDIPDVEGCYCVSEASAWLSSELMTDGEYNAPDILQTEGVIKNVGTEEAPEYRLDITFSEPYSITESGVYVGYSVTVDKLKDWTQKYPIVTVCNSEADQGFMIHCTKGDSSLPQKYPEWTDLGYERNESLAMRVIMRGDIKENAAQLDPRHTLYSAPGEEGYVFTMLTNHGVTPISSLVYSYTVDGVTRQNEITIDPPVESSIGSFTILDLPFIAPSEVGQYQVEVNLESVNGVTNSKSENTVLDVEVVPFLPKHIPLVEDYTGFWCGYCPAVYVAMKNMKDKFGDDFIGLSYHCSDQLASVVGDDKPSSAYGLPKLYVEDRENEISHNNLENIWKYKSRELAPADIDLKLYWTDKSHSALRVESITRFVSDHPEGEYMLTYALVEDDMSDPSWKQQNKYYDSDFSGSYWDLFCGTSPIVTNLVYDEIVLHFPHSCGIPGSLPSSIEGGLEYAHSCVLNLEDAINRDETMANYGKNIINNPDKLRVVALLIDGKTGEVCNVASTGYSADAEDYLSEINDDGIVVNPSGEKKIYSRSSVSVMPLGDTAGETRDYGFAGVLVFGENGEVYLKNPFSQFVTDTYIKGVATQELPVKSDEPNILIFELPQLVTIYEEDGESYDLYACMLSFSEDGTELETSDCQTLEFILEDGCWVMLDSEAILGLTFDDSEWTGFAEREIKYTPISEETAKVPSDLEYESWMLTYGNEGHYVDVAIDGKNCYVKNFLPTSEASLAPMVGEIENDMIRFKSPQYLGVNEDISYLTYFYAGDVNRKYLEEYDTMVTTFIPKEEMTFKLSTGGTYTSDETALFTPYTDIENEYFWHIDLFEKPSLQKSVVEDYVPANPSVVDYRYYSNFGFGYVSFDIPMLNREGMVLDSEHLYYNVYLDGEILEFNSDEYPLFEESMTDIPYNFEDGVNGNGDIKLEDSKHTVILYREGLEEVGIQSFYLDATGNKYYSDLITAFTSGVDKLIDDCGIVDVKYIDMLGRETRHPENGIFIRRVLLNNGSVISTKVRIK